MWILFDGVFGIVGISLGLLDAAAGEAWLSVAPEADRRGLLGFGLAASSSLAVGRGGGNGEIEMEVTEAEWAW